MDRITRTQLRKDKFHIFPIAIIILVFLSILSLMEDRLLRTIGEDCINLLLIVITVYFIYALLINRSYHIYKKLLIALAIFFIIQLFSFFLFHSSSIIDIIKLLMFILMISSFVFIKWNKIMLIFVASIVSFLTIFLLINWINIGSPNIKFQSYFRNPNGLGAILFCFNFFLVQAITHTKKIWQLFFIVILSINIVLMYFTTSRTVLLASGVILISWLIYLYKKKLFKYLFQITVCFNLVFITLYIYLYDTAIGKQINILSHKLFHKNFYSGRESIWKEVIKFTLNSPIFGNGYGFKSSNITSSGLMPHNVYLEVFLDSGVIGLIALLFIFYALWKLLIKNINIPAVQISAFFFIGILIYSNFEFVLFPSPSVAIGILQWLIITFGLNFSLNKKNKLPGKM